MKIYTSYFGNMKALQAADIKPISIARWSPRFFQGLVFREVAPTPYMLRQCSHEEYLRMYAEILSRLNANEFLNKIKVVSFGRDVALLCYEKPNDFCHRHLLADWLHEKTGVEIEEFGAVTKTPQVARQGTLF